MWYRKITEINAQLTTGYVHVDFALLSTCFVLGNLILLLISNLILWLFL